MLAGVSPPSPHGGGRARQNARISRAVPPGLLSRIRLDPMLAALAPNDQTDARRGGVAKGHRRAGFGFHLLLPRHQTNRQNTVIIQLASLPEVGMVKAMPLERRRKAALFRRVANIPTSGGRLADRAPSVWPTNLTMRLPV